MTQIELAADVGFARLPADLQWASAAGLTTRTDMKRGAEVAAIRARFEALDVVMNEALRRRWVAAEARELGRGGQSLVAAATGISLPTIRKGIRELEGGVALPPHRIRRPGGGRKPLLSTDPTLLDDMQALLPAAVGTLPLRWVGLTPLQLQAALSQRGHTISAPSVAALLAQRGYRWQTGPEALAAEAVLLRWRYLSARVQQFLRCGQPVLAVDVTRLRSERPDKVDAQSLVGSRYAPGASLATSLAARVLRPASDGLPAFVGAALRAFVQPRPPGALSAGGELLLLVGHGRGRQPPARWQTECEQLAAELRMRVQLLLVPPGIYRWEELAQCLTCDVERAFQAGASQRVRIELGLLTGPAARRRAELAAHIYARSYPRGLIADAQPAPSGVPWSFASRRRHVRRSGVPLRE